MKHYHFRTLSVPFFEGWYVKHQKGKNLIALIPGMHCDGMGSLCAFIQIITPEFSRTVEYPFDRFYADRKRFYIRVGNSSFRLEGAVLDIRDGDFSCTGQLSYSGITPIAYDIMGPFSAVPGMECSHGVLSMHHTIRGHLTVNGEKMDLNSGIGYIEKDWGRSFPESYTWLQCNDFPGRTAENKRAVMLSVARIPYHALRFEGLIAVIYDGGREFRIATYNGGKVLKNDGREIVVRRGKYLLKATVEATEGMPLKAPLQGEMSRLIMERAACRARFEFRIRGEQVFLDRSNHASCEIVEK